MQYNMYRVMIRPVLLRWIILLDAEFPGLIRIFHIHSTTHIRKNQYGSVAVTGQQKDAVKFAKDAIAYCTSGLVDRNKHTVLILLYKKAIKALNQLRMIEDSLVIYRLSRSFQKEEYFILMLVIYQKQRLNNIFVR